MAISTHNKYVSIPDWFSSSSSTPVTTVEKPTNVTNVYYGGGGGTAGITEIPIDNKTVVWLDLVITVPIDNDKIIINTEGKITTSGTTGVWELRQLTDGTNYIYTTYPVVTQLGVTMYAGTDGLNLGNIYDGLPIDGVTLYWSYDSEGNKILKSAGSADGEGGVSDFWALSNIPSWITVFKPYYTTSEISEGNNLYFTNARAVSALAETLTTYVPIKGYTEIVGEKNFTGGLKVNGSPIYYDTDKKYWKLEGDLLVTGGITMYGSDSSFTPSTIMDAIVVDGTTISKSGGVLKVIGGTGGGVADSVAWGNITGKPEWIGSSKPTYSYSEITGAISTTELQNYLTSNSYLNVTSGDNRYLKLSGGTLTGTANVITINRTDLNQPCISYEYNGNSYGSLGLKGYGDPFVYNASTKVLSQIYHKENISTLKTDLGLGTNAYTSTSYLPSLSYTATDVLAKIKTVDGSGSGLDADLLDGKHLSDILASNVASATKLQTTRTIWGQSFDGTGNVSGALSDVTGITFKNDYYGLIIDEFGNFSFKKPYSTTAVDWSFKDSSGNKLMIVNNYGNVGIGTPNPNAKLHIVNNTNTSTGLRLDGGWSGYGFLYNAINIYLNGEHYGGIGVNTVSSAYGSTAAGTYITNAKSGEYMNFYNEGGTFLKSSLLVNGGITMYSDQRKKTILNHVELSLKQIAEAPLIEHYYNGDDNKTTHVGSIAQYWASMNDWFCKLDSEGFYTMEIQNAALASAISIARELDRYETKTDKAIKKLKKRICELEEEVELLKSA